MARKKNALGPKTLPFRDRLILNQWLISLFGIDPLREHKDAGRKVRPFHLLSSSLKITPEGLGADNLHHFFHNLVNQVLALFSTGSLTREQILVYEENIVRHTRQINEKRARPVVWKYYQWLTLLFAETYLDRWFHNRTGLLEDLNAYVERFNRHWVDFADVPFYADDDLNKLCLQNATGSGKTLIMHVNLLQFRHYAGQSGQEDELSRVILLTPNERLTEQHARELEESGLAVNFLAEMRGGLYGSARGLRQVDLLEITKLADKDGPKQIATRSLGDRNLMLVDEGHRGMSGNEEKGWFNRRDMLCQKGFTFEYSATFEQAVAAANDAKFDHAYARTILFDYSYRYFYEDGFGKDYQILNLPKSFSDAQEMYLTACLLKFYQQLRIYQDNPAGYTPFNLEKPLWIFVGSTVTGGNNDTCVERKMLGDVALILQFVAEFLHAPNKAMERINRILTGTGKTTGLLDQDGNDIFSGAFDYLVDKMNVGEALPQLHRDILTRLFNNPAGGALVLERIKGNSGEVILKCGAADEPFGLINVGDAIALCRHCERSCAYLTVTDSDFTEAMFASVNESSSSINLLLGSKKFVEGWDCWRVSTMGLMHVGKKEGSQIIQLFGRGVRLKGWEWSLKRSGHSAASLRPRHIEALETLNVFGVEADFMDRFRQYLAEEGLPGNKQRQTFTIPLNVTYDFGKKLKILRPKRKKADGREYDFKKDGPIPSLGVISEHLHRNRVVSDWYPRIQVVERRRTAPATEKNEARFRASHLALMDFDALYFELEQFKREKSWYNLNISKEGIRVLLTDSNWYRLLIPEARMAPDGFSNVRLWQQIATELLKRYCEHFYNHCKSAYLEPRLEYRDLVQEDDNIPQDDHYQLIVDGSEAQLIQSIKQLKDELENGSTGLLQVGELAAHTFGRHLYQPLLYTSKGSKVRVLPVALEESELQFVTDLSAYHQEHLEKSGTEVFLLRNMSRGRGIGFFEAGNFHPDFIMWVLRDNRQFVTFLEPHGLLHEGPASPKVLFHQKIKEIEARLGDPNIILNSYLLSWTRHPQLNWGISREEMEANHVLFMTEDRDGYIRKLFSGFEENQAFKPKRELSSYFPSNAGEEALCELALSIVRQQDGIPGYQHLYAMLLATAPDRLSAFLPKAKKTSFFVEAASQFQSFFPGQGTSIQWHRILNYLQKMNFIVISDPAGYCNLKIFGKPKTSLFDKGKIADQLAEWALLACNVLETKLKDDVSVSSTQTEDTADILLLIKELHQREQREAA
ncbi:MAG: DEAD/DEAH box helicase family protein [Magnetococcales bacterium]|nr:DEAD/DEAH box helicase family protein [Magnetococcales bacterium]